MLGSAGHYFLTRSYHVADISATQSAKFLDLIWSAGMGWLFFSDLPTFSTILGGVIISAATLWVARRESRRTWRRCTIDSGSMTYRRWGRPVFLVKNSCGLRKGPA